MLVVLLAVMMRGARGEIVLGGSAETEDELRIDRAIGHGEHRHGARHLGGDRLPSLLQAVPAPARSALVSSTISAQQIWSSNTSDSGVS